MSRQVDRLDVLIPHFDDVDGLKLSLESIAGQDWTGRMRIVIADDGSSINHKRALRQLLEASELPTVLIDSDANRGRPHTRNVLLDAIDSSHVTWLDSGDEWYPQKTSAQVQRLATLDPGDEHVWVTCHYDWKWHGRARRLVRQVVDQDQARAILVGDDLRCYLWTLLAPADAFRSVGWFDQRLSRLQDVDFFLRFVLKGGRLIDSGMDGALCVYHKSDVGRDADQIRACYQHIFDKHRVVYSRYGSSFMRERLFQMDTLASRFAMNNQQFGTARRYAWRAFRLNPLLFTLKAAKQSAQKARSLFRRGVKRGQRSVADKHGG